MSSPQPKDEKQKLRDIVFQDVAGESQYANDLVNISEWVRGFYESHLNQKVAVPERLFLPILNTASLILTRNTKIPNPSVFKRAAAFTAAFAVKSPLKYPFGTTYPELITTIANHQNAIIPIEICTFILTGARIDGHGATRDLKNPIMISNHQYCDLVHAVASIRESDCDVAFALLAIAYESLCYRTNPLASDDVYDPDGEKVNLTNDGAFT